MFHILRQLPYDYEYIGNSFDKKVANRSCAELILQEKEENVHYIVMGSQELTEYYIRGLITEIPNQTMIDITKELA